MIEVVECILYGESAFCIELHELAKLLLFGVEIVCSLIRTLSICSLENLKKNKGSNVFVVAIVNIRF